MTHLRYFAALLGAPILAALTAASPAFAVVGTAANDFIPAASQAAAAAPGPFSSQGWNDPNGSIWSTDASGNLTPSGYAGGGSPWNTAPLVRASGGTDDVVTQEAVVTATWPSGSAANLWYIFHGSALQTAGSGSGLMIGVSLTGAQLYELKAGSATSISGYSNPSFNLVAGEKYKLVMTAIGNGSSSTTLKLEIYDPGGRLVAITQATDTTTTNSLQTGTQQGVFSYYAASAQASAPKITEITNYPYSAYSAAGYSITGLPITWGGADSWDDLTGGAFGTSTEAMQTATPGAYLKFDVTGSTAGLVIDNTTLAANGLSGTIAYRFSIDGAAWNYNTVTASSSNAAMPVLFNSTLLPNATHDVVVEFMSMSDGASGSAGKYSTNASNSPFNVLRINGVLADSASAVQAYGYNGYTAPSCQAVMKGDSITQTKYAQSYINSYNQYPSWPYTFGPSGTNGGDYAQLGWASKLGRYLNCDYSQIGYGYSGVSVSTGSGTNSASEVKNGGGSYGWGSYFSAGRPRPILPGVSAVFEDGGTNEWLQSIPSTTFIADEVTLLGQDRAQFPNAYIFVTVPINGMPVDGVHSSGTTAKKADLSAALNQYLAAHPGETKMYLIDVTGSAFLPVRSFQANGVNGGCVGSADCTHPLDEVHATYAGLIAQAASAITGAKSPSFRPGFFH